MPAKSRSQQKLFCMALAVRHGTIKRSDVNSSVLDIVDSDMTNKQIEDFTVLSESVENSGCWLYNYIIRNHVLD